MSHSPAINLTILQLKHALDFAIGDGLDAEQDTSVTMRHFEAITDDEGDVLPAGIYVWLTEHPEEGRFGPLGPDVGICRVKP